MCGRWVTLGRSALAGKQLGCWMPRQLWATSHDSSSSSSSSSRPGVIKIQHSSRNVAVGRVSSASRPPEQRFTGGHVDRNEQRVGGRGSAGRRRRVSFVEGRPVVDRCTLLRHRRRPHLRLLHHTADRLTDSKEQARPRNFQVVQCNIFKTVSRKKSLKNKLGIYLVHNLLRLRDTSSLLYCVLDLHLHFLHSYIYVVTSTCTTAEGHR